MTARPESQTLRSEAEVRADLQRKLSALVDNARVSPTTSAFMRSVMTDIIETTIAGALDTDRLRYLATDKENWRALYDLAESAEGSMAETDANLDGLRELIDQFRAMDEEAAT